VCRRWQCSEARRQNLVLFFLDLKVQPCQIHCCLICLQSALASGQKLPWFKPTVAWGTTTLFCSSL
jgi:hypothetical protein